MSRKLPATLTTDKRGNLLLRKKRPLQGRTFRVFNKLAVLINWDLIVDVGSNYGEMIFYSSIPKDKKICVIEPNPDIFACLCVNLKEFANIEFINMAVSARNGHAYLDTNRGHSGKSSITKENIGLKVKTVRLERLLGGFDYGRVFIKIDTEGGEQEIIKSIAHKTGTLPVWLAETYAFSKTDFEEILSDYFVFDIDSNKSRVIEITRKNLSRYLAEKNKGNNCLLVPIKNLEVISLVKGLRGKLWFFIELLAGWLHRRGFSELLVGRRLNRGKITKVKSG